MTTWTVRDILDATGGSLVRGHPEDRLSGLSIDSRSLLEGEGFVAIRGKRLDGHQFLEDATHRGAACLIVAEHQCMSCRGVRRPNTRVVTLLAHGACAEEPVRAETMRLLLPSH